MKNYILGASLLAVFGGTAQASTLVNANITAPLTKWTVANSPYILQGPIYVKDGAVLDIEPGTIIRGQPATSSSTFDPGSLVITKTGKIQARGTSTNPIIFTTAALDAGLVAGGAATGIAYDGDANGKADRWLSNADDSKFLDANPLSAPLPPRDSAGNKNANFWGGLVIAGNSFTNSGNQVDADGNGSLDDGKGIIEGLSGADAIYGGTNGEDNSGIIKYVSIRHGGDNLVSGKELNGLTLYAVGSRTTVSFIDVYSTGDDGVEIFGGTVNINHVNINYADDDGLDLDEGYSGTIQYVFVLQGYGYGDNGMELDGEDKLEGNTISSTGLPIGDARIYNATVLMSAATYPASDNSSASGTAINGARLRAGFSGHIVNSIFVNTATNVTGTAAGQGIRIDGLKTTGLAVGETIETAPSARDYFGTTRTQIRNNAVYNFQNNGNPTPVSTNYTAFTANSMTLSNTGSLTGTLPDAVLYPTVGLRSGLNGAGVNPLIATPVHNSNVNPRPSLSANAAAYGTTQDIAYVVTGADPVPYKGAFDRTAATLWTTGWTALNARNILK